MPMRLRATPEHIREVNTRYHDVAADSYDSKWGIDFGEVGREQVRAKMSKALDDWPVGDGEAPFPDALEVGAGTGYFTLNLSQLGLIDRATATDISQGMLDALERSAKRLGLDVETARADAEQLPFEDESFDLVYGHAVLHHIPDLKRALDELRRVLRPGGTLAFCGEPSRYGDALAVLPKRGGAALSPLWRRLVGVPARRWKHRTGSDDHELEREVDVHAFTPGALRGLLDNAGFDDVKVRGEELLANLYGWGLRSLEAGADPDRVPRRWQSFAFRSYLALQRLDAALLEPRLPPALFYNLVLSARRPG